jgi:DNA-binding transcriptional ArsR family regulator
MVVIDDDLWSAVGDPTRRRMLDELLLAGSATATTLSEHVPVTRQAVAKHLDVLERAGLVHATAMGRERRYQVDDIQLSRAVAQLSTVGATWDRRDHRTLTTLHERRKRPWLTSSIASGPRRPRTGCTAH